MASLNNLADILNSCRKGARWQPVTFIELKINIAIE
jgi:hypothetical protein